MQWIPAIDLKDGQVVRLKQGLMDEATVYSADPVEMAKRWIDQGTRRLHLVDLNGAFVGEPVNLRVIEQIARLDSQLKIQVGGGIRTRETIRRYLDAGVSYCILGTIAIKDRTLTQALLTEFQGNIILGIDAKNGKVAAEGWAEESAITAIDLACYYEMNRPEAIVYTDISRDGMLTGPNIDASVALARAISTPVIISGGISSIDDLRKIKPLGKNGIAGAILGKALYEGRLNLAEALAL